MRCVVGIRKRGSSGCSSTEQPVRREPKLALHRFFPFLAIADLPEGKLLARFGDVLYWLCCAFAVVIFGWGAHSVFTDDPHGSYKIGLAAVLAFAAWAIGRACRFLLSGK